MHLFNFYTVQANVHFQHILHVTSCFLHGQVYKDVRTCASSISQALAISSNLIRKSNSSSNLLVHSHVTCISASNSMRISDRQVCYSCKLTRPYRSLALFLPHSGCWYLGDPLLQLAVLSSQLPLHWTNTETVFTPSWSFPSTRSCVMGKKDLLKLGSPKNVPHLCAWRKAQNWACRYWHRTWKKAVSAEVAEAASSCESVAAVSHLSHCVPPAPTQIMHVVGEQERKISCNPIWRASLSIPALGTISASSFYTPAPSQACCLPAQPGCRPSVLLQRSFRCPAHPHGTDSAAKQRKFLKPVQQPE